MSLGATPLRANWEPFGRPLFEDSAARALSRVGVVDVGSNSVRLVVFDGAGRSPAYFYNEKIMCGLGVGMSETNRLHPEGRKRAVAALCRFQALAIGMNITPPFQPSPPKLYGRPRTVPISAHRSNAKPDCRFR